MSLASHEWERLPAAAALAQRYPDALVALTLPDPVTAFNCHDCPNRVARLARLGVAPARVIVVPVAESATYGEAAALARHLRDRRPKAIVVVTSPYHTRRALAAFRRAFSGTGMRLGIVPASATSPANPDAWWAAPYDRWYVRYEWAAIGYYAVRYGVVPFRDDAGCVGVS